ncbi:retrotransposon protein, putative, ty1-copia subclass, partial [Tanacetum coccineum]
VNEGFRGGGDGGGRTSVKGLGVVMTTEMQVGEGFRGGVWEVFGSLYLFSFFSINDTDLGGFGMWLPLKDILGPAWQNNKHGRSPCSKLDVWVPKKIGFTELVKVEQSEVKGGFSIAIFCYALQLLPFKVQPIFRPFINDKGESNGTYDQLLHHIEGKTCQAVAGDVTIRASRAEFVDFTIPYLSSEVYMLVHGSHDWNQTLWTFLRPFTWRLWITIVCACIFIGAAVAILEYRAGNPKFTAPYFQTLRMVIWFPISTFFFNEGKILNRNSKVVLVMWLSMIFIVVQIFTATLSSWLTLDQLRPKVPTYYGNAGYQDGSFLKEFIMQKCKCSGDDLLALESVEEYKNAFSNRSVKVIFDELPYIDLFLAKYGSGYMKYGPINQESGIAFAFPRESSLLPSFSRAVINITESDTMMDMKKKYLGFPILDQSQPNQPLPQSLDVRKGYTIKLQSGKVKVINGSRVILSGIRRNNCVYSLDGHAMAGELNASVEEKDSLAQVWHKRLGHISEAGLQVLEKQGLFGKKSLGKLDICDNCVLGKSHRVSFDVGRHTTQGVIDYVHSDLWGPSQVESLGGKRYFLSIVDDYSMRVWVYILRFKHEAFEKFKEWKQLVENQTGRTVKKLRTNNGLEFCNREFEQLCIESRIARHLTVVGTPQQNRVAERMNKTLMDKVRCLLIQSGLPKTFWAEATCTPSYLINRSPSRAIEKKTHIEMWLGHPSDYGMLRIFGCVAYPHDKQGKLEPRAVKCILLGYPEGVKGYRLYRLDDESPKIVTSRNVVFNESVMYKDTLKDSGADQKDQEDDDDEDAGDQETDQPPDLTDYQLVRDREPRTRTKPLRFQDESNMAAYAFVAAEEEDTHEPLTYQEAVACEDSSKWKAAMKEEMDSLRKNKTWELVDHLAGQKLVSCKWLFKIKEGIEGVQKPRYKARLVARGFTQRACIDYNEVFSPVVRHTSIRVILALTACKDYELEQLDVKTTFLHGNLEEVIYMRQPQGYEQDDMLIACKSKAEIGSTKSLLKKEFDMKELGEAKKILGMEIVRDQSRKILRVSQSGYVSKILNNFRIDNGKSVKMPLGGHFKLSLKDCPVRDCDVKRMSKVPYANAVGSLMYLMVCTRLDIAYAVSVVSRYLANPGKKHWEAMKWILKYLRGTTNVGLVYGTDRGNHVDVTGFVDSDYAKDPDKGRSITGYIFLVRGCVVSWKATLQHVVALSTTEAEYMALTEAVKEAIWLRGLLEELGVELNTVAVLEAKKVKVLKVGTEHNVADALTKAIPGLKLQYCLELLNVGVG